MISRLLPALSLTIATASLSAPSVLHGDFALAPAQLRTHGILVVGPGRAPLEKKLDTWLTDGTSRTVTSYRLDMTKLMHMIVIRDDFSTFSHVHPIFGSDGHFRIETSFPKPGRYYVFTDVDVDDDHIGHQVFRYAVTLGSAAALARRPNLRDRGPHVRIGGYDVRLSTTVVRAGVRTRIGVRIERHGKPATDLRPYLGALAHAVFVGASDLSYIHVHPMAAGSRGDTDMSMVAMDAMLPASRPSSSDMALGVMLPRAGVYGLWLQFRGGKALHVAPFVVTAR